MTEKELIKLFNSFTEKNIVIIGDVMIDAYMWGKVERISPEAPVPVVTCHKKENRLGGAANVALNVQSLGAEPILCSMIGDDEKGKLFWSLMEKTELSTEGILHSKYRPTTSKTRVISNNQHLIRVDEEDDQALNSEEINIFREHLIKIIEHKKLDAVIFEDYDKGCITNEIIKSVTEKCKEKNIPTLVDPKKRNFMNYKGVTLFKPNYKELVEGLKKEVDKTDFQGLRNISDILRTKLDAEIILVTLSELGIFISTKEKFERIPAEIRDIADVSGAGDTVISTAALCLSAEISLKNIASISNLAGGLVCEKVGVVPIDKNKLLNESIKFFKSEMKE